MPISLDTTGFLLAKAAQRWNELLAAAFAHEGFGDARPAYGSVLVPLFVEDGERIGALTGRARLAPQTMTSMLAQMDRAGLVERVPDPSDGRATIVRLGPRGRAFRPVAERVLAELDARVAAAIPAAALADTHRTLKESVPAAHASPPFQALRPSQTDQAAIARPTTPSIHQPPDHAYRRARRRCCRCGRAIWSPPSGERRGVAFALEDCSEV